MKRLEIVPTTYEDIDFIFGILEDAIAYQKRKRVPIWPLFERSAVENNILNKRQYKILIEKKIACIFTVLLEDKVVWRTRDKKNAIYLHGIIVNPDFKGQRLFSTVLQWAIQFAKAKNLDFVRMDTWADNPNLIEYYKSFGFEFIEYYTTPDSPDLPLQQRGNKVILLQYPLSHS